VKRLRADVWPSGEPVHEDEVEGVKVSFYKHPDTTAVDQIELVEAEIYWRDGTVSRVILRGSVLYDVEPVLALRGCNVDAEIRCSSFSCVHSGILNLLARLGVDERSAMAVEVQIW
jgi:hypothetical protein